MKNLIGITFFLVVVSVYGINPPTLNSPANQANVQGFQTTLIIGGVATATGFQIQFDSVASFNSSWMSINAFTPVGQPQGSQGTISPVLKLNRTYFWRARAFAPNDTSAWTTTRSFATIQTTTFLLGPASNSVGAIQSLRCSNFGNNTLIQYLFEVDTNNTFTSPLRKLSIQSTNQWSDSSLLKFNRTIYWRVTAINNLGDTTNWSPTWKYTTDNGPTLNMGLNQIVNVDPEFNVSWTAVGLSAVQVQFDTVNTFNSPNLLTNLKASGAIQDTFRNLLFDQIYQIRIRAIYNTDTSAWSPTRLCRASTGNVTNPPNGSSVGTITPINLFWTPLKGTSVIMKLYADSALTQLLADTITSAGNYIYRDTLRLYKWYQLHITYFHSKDTSSTRISHFNIFSAQVNLFSPASNANNLSVVVPFQFRGYSWAKKYLLQIDTGAVFPAIRSSYFQQFTSFDTVPFLKYLTTTALLSYNKTYSWRVYTITSQDTGTPIASTFTTAARPTLYSPPNGFIGIGTDVNGLVTSIKGSSYVQWQLDTTSLFNSALLQSSIDTAVKDEFDTNYVLVNLPQHQLFHTKYFWRCRNISSKDTSLWSAAFSYVTTTNVDLIKPLNNAVNVPIKVPLDWSIQGSNLSQRFQYQIGTDSNFTTTPIVTLPLNEFSEDTFNAAYATTYYWRARAFNAVDTSKWSVRYSFKTQNVPAVGSVSLITPANNATNILPGLVVFDWFGANNATSYDVEVATDANFTTIVASGSTTFPGSQWNNAQPRTKYYWRVRGKSSVNTGAWSVRNFTTTVPVGQAESFTIAPLKIYPNPATNKVFIELSQAFQISIYSTLGELVWQQPYEKQQVEINTESWAQGMYVVVFSNQEITYKQSVMVTK